VREMSISENYEGEITPIRSNISRFSRGTHERIDRYRRFTGGFARKNGHRRQSRRTVRCMRILQSHYLQGLC
jgi:hypothetical protein